MLALVEFLYLEIANTFHLDVELCQNLYGKDNMRIFTFCGILILLTPCLLLVGCVEDLTDPLSINDFSGINFGGDGNGNGGNGNGGDSNGGMVSGEWAEYAYDGEYDEIERLEYFGIDTYSGYNAYVLEYEWRYDDEVEIEQTWIEVNAGSVLLTLYEYDEEIDTEEYSIMSAFLLMVSSAMTYGVWTGNQSYTTPTGKTIQAAVYSFGDAEYWINDSTPFRLVKYEVFGDYSNTMELYDYGTSGAKKDISKSVAESYQITIQGPGKIAKQNDK